MKKLGVFSIVLFSLSGYALAQETARYSEEYRKGFVNNCVREGQVPSFCECIVDEFPKYVSESELASGEIRKSTDHKFGKRWAERIVQIELESSVPCLIKERRN